MSEPITCPSCRAANPAGATWCSLCFQRFGQVEPKPDAPVENTGPARTDHDTPAPLAPPPPPPARPPAPATDEGEQLALIEDDEAPDQTWTCRFCETVVPVEEVECPVCQQTIYDSFGQKPPSVELDPQTALRRSILPGGGHFALKQSIIASTILALTAISIGMGVYFLAKGVIRFGAALTFIGMTIWMLAAHDAYRVASGTPDEIFLRPRTLSIVTGVWFVIIVAAVVSAQPVIGQ